MTPPDRLPGSEIPASRVGFGMSRPGRNSAGSATPEEPDNDTGEETLPPDAEVDLSKDRAETGIDDVFESLDEELVGLAPVKKRIREIAALLLVDRARARFGLSTSRPNLHMNFTGSPGTGKTTVARQLGLRLGLPWLQVDDLRDELAAN